MVVIGNKSIKELLGEVISDKSEKTRTVLVKTVKMHPLYKKRFIVRKKYFILSSLYRSTPKNENAACPEKNRSLRKSIKWNQWLAVGMNASGGTFR